MHALPVSLQPAGGNFGEYPTDISPRIHLAAATEASVWKGKPVVLEHQQREHERRLLTVLLIITARSLPGPGEPIASSFL